MELSFICGKGIGKITKQLSNELPKELKIEGDVTTNSVRVYIKSIDYLLRGVTNFASGKVLGAGVSVNHLGVVDKNGYSVKWGFKVPKSEVVTYTMNINTIKESMYYADAILSDGVSITPVENKGLLKLKEEQLRSNLVKGVVSLGESKLPYYYSYEADKLVLKVRETDTVIDVEDVEEDDIYIALKLASLLMSKTEHLALVLLDCSGFSDAALNYLIELHKLFQKEYGVNLLFVYNVSKGSTIKTDMLYLPDIENK